jgi:hypothetical protein
MKYQRAHGRDEKVRVEGYMERKIDATYPASGALASRTAVANQIAIVAGSEGRPAMILRSARPRTAVGQIAGRGGLDRPARKYSSSSLTNVYSKVLAALVWSRVNRQVLRSKCTSASSSQRWVWEQARTRAKRIQ